MCLTEFVEYDEMRDLFDATAVPLRGIGLRNKDTPLVCPPLSAAYGLTGTAFDYLARWTLARRYAGGSVRVVTRPWVAEAGLADPGGFLSKRQARHYRRLMRETRKLAASYLKGEPLALDRLADGAQVLANLDALYRCGRCDPTYEPRADVTRDLLALLAAFEAQADGFGQAATLWLNPAFVAKSDIAPAIGNADADLIADDLLLDIKTVKSVGIQGVHLRQLAGYAALATLGGVRDGDTMQPVPVARVGIYYARHARMKIWTLTELFPAGRWDEYLMGFRAIAVRETRRMARRAARAAKMRAVREQSAA